MADEIKISYAKRMLNIIEGVLEGRITKDVESVSILGRAITKIPLAELFKLRDKFKKEVLAEERKKKLKGSVSISRVVFK